MWINPNCNCETLGVKNVWWLLSQVASGVLDLEHTVTDVIEAKEYLFSVTACNKCGPGEPAYIDEPVNISSPASKYFTYFF